MKKAFQALFKRLSPTFLAGCTLLVWEGGCQAPDPVKGWNSWNATLQPPNVQQQGTPYYQINQAIIDDYKAFIQLQKRKYSTLYVSEIYFYENASGAHAVRLIFEIEPREYVEYYLVYNKENIRTKVIKGQAGHQFHI